MIFYGCSNYDKTVKKWAFYHQIEISDFENYSKKNRIEWGISNDYIHKGDTF